MRKIMLTIATALLTIVMCFSSLLGCNLVTVDNERDMNQVVATVQLDKTAPVETIYKKDMIISYLNYYYQLEQSGYTRAQTFETIIENLVNNRVFVQYAMMYFNGKGMGDSNDKWNIEKYLTDGTSDPEDNELLDAKYSAYKDMNELIDSYVTDKEEDKVGDTYSETARVAPTGATTNTELTAAEKAQYINKGIDVTERRKAFSDVINVLKNNDLLGDEYCNNDITTTTYYKETINSYYEQALIAKFEEDITAEARAKVTFDMVEAEYDRLYNIQKGYSNTEFVTALDSVSAQSPILYSAYNGYGMVYNLLLGIDEDMSADLQDITAKYTEDNGTPVYKLSTYRADRKNLFASITAKDLRTSWIYSGYDFEEQETAPLSSYGDYKYAFTGDYTLLKEESLPFFGDVTLLNNSEKPAAGEFDLDYKPQYRVDEVKEFELEEFVALVNNYLYSSPATSDGTSPEIYKTVTGTPKDNYHERVRELMFAFSTDSSDSALNTYRGYVIKNEADMGETESWMEEFAAAGRRVIANGEGSYEIVATDYGYHFIFFADCFNKRDYATIEDYLANVYGISDALAEYNKMLADWEDYEDTDNYLYVLVNSLASTSVSNAFSKIQQEILNDYVYTGSSVVKYTDAYADLVAD